MTTEETFPTTGELWKLLQEQAVEVRGLRAELERQRMEKLSLVAEVAELKGSRMPTERKLSRAGLLKAAAAGAAGLAAGFALGGPDEAAASTGTMQYGTSQDADTETSLLAVNNQSTGAGFAGTSILQVMPDPSQTVTGDADGVRGMGNGAGSGLVGIAQGASRGSPLQSIGVYGTAFGTSKVGVLGDSETGNGVRGIAYSGTGVFGYGGLYGAFFQGNQVPLHLVANPGVTPPPLIQGTYDVGDIWMGQTGRTIWIGTAAGSTGTWVPVMHGQSNDGTNDALFTTVSTEQYTLTSSDGVLWVDMDPATLSLTFTPVQNSLAIVSANSDLWTSNTGYNQDLGITISGGSYPKVVGQPEAWKESGGSAAAFSPNAAFVQTVQQLVGGTSYTVKLQWKTNRDASGASIWAGAGPIGGKFSPTRLTVLLIPSP